MSDRRLEDVDLGTLDDVADVEVDSPELGEALRQDESDAIIPRCEFLTGGAGTGKTTEIRRRMDAYKNDFPYRERAYAVLAATTGIAAINLGQGTTTINSLLKFFDIESMRDANQRGRILAGLKEAFRLADNLCMDECSMAHAEMIDIIWENLVALNQQEEVKQRGGFGLILTGDFCQLPPVPEKDAKTGKPLPIKFAFESICWEHFEANTTKLTKVWRQDDPEFIKALKYAREGDGVNCAATLSKHPGVKFTDEIDNDFDGTTIFSKNPEVDRHNATHLRQLLYKGAKKITVRSFRWGKQRGEWKNIPTELEVCEGCFVMILANDSKQSGFRYANGSTGDVVRFHEKTALPSVAAIAAPTVVAPLAAIAAIAAPQAVPVADDDPELAGMDLDGDEPAPKPAYGSPSALASLLDASRPQHEEDDPEEGGTPLTFKIKLRDKAKEGLCVEIGRITRRVLQKDHPEGKAKPEYLNFKDWKEQNAGLIQGMTAKAVKVEYEYRYLRGLTQQNKSSHRMSKENGCTCGWKQQIIEGADESGEWIKHVKEQPPEVYFDYEEGKWITGEITYYPLRIAYATTVHKSQGLTLDKVQIDFINQFFGQPSMAYVALSRVRTAEGLRLVGSARLLAERCNVSKKVVRFL